jgi:hypothetical protein
MDHLIRSHFQTSRFAPSAATQPFFSQPINCIETMIMMSHPYADPFISQTASPETDAQEQASSLLSKYQVSVPVAILDNFARSSSSELDAGCEPRDRDVVCGRGKGSYNRPGNVMFRSVIRMYIKDYLAARTKFEKTTVLNQVIDHLHNEEHARFLKFNSKSKQWFEITDDQAREKVGHTMRETIASLDSNQPDNSQKRSDLMASQKAIFEAMLRSNSPPAAPSRAVSSMTAAPAATPITQYRMPWDDDEQCNIPRTEV